MIAIVTTFTLLCGTPVVARMSLETKVHHDTSEKDGVVVTKTKVTETIKHETR